MELGNLCFGCSRGKFEVPRENPYESAMAHLLETCKIGTFESEEYVNDVFEVHPYYWGDCTCGYEKKADAWSEKNKHDKGCYQIELEKAHAVISKRLDAKEIDYDEYAKLETQAAKGLCKKHGIPWDGGQGCLVHCTCDHEKRWAEFAAKNDHAESCLSVRPNFIFKKAGRPWTGYRLMWYKYPLRDSYANMDLGGDEFVKMINECVASVVEKMHEVYYNGHCHIMTTPKKKSTKKRKRA